VSVSGGRRSAGDAEVGHGRRRADLEDRHRQVEASGGDHGVAQTGLVGERFREVGIRRQREVGDADLGERREPDQGVVDRLRPEAVGDHPDLEPGRAGVTGGGQHHRVGKQGLAALEVDHGAAGGRGLVDDRS
jgi:hypothetical protein